MSLELTFYRRSFTYKHRKTSKEKPRKNRLTKHAIILGRVISSKGHHVDTIVEIKSVALRDVLLEINDGVEGIELSLTEPKVLNLISHLCCLLLTLFARPI